MFFFLNIEKKRGFIKPTRPLPSYESLKICFFVFLYGKCFRGSRSPFLVPENTLDENPGRTMKKTRDRYDDLRSCYGQDLATSGRWLFREGKGDFKNPKTKNFRYNQRLEKRAPGCLGDFVGYL